ncbi:MAG TPA: 16S rRNA (cytosine(967)-C(5))-methyltransferase RsmB [Candidatus Sulfotelmatobacter sp.]|nr:16S rRNA (cytosine(967)-C(5))-methyltransferase RsmB [Candidatus Sulfotelmatobacter sp.]
MPVSPARVVAFDILLRVERQSSYASELLHSSACENLSPVDHSLATELVMGVIRWRLWLDAQIAPASSQPLSKLDLEVLIALRLAVYQLRFLTRIPEHAILNESVELVKRARKRSAAPFTNAVLRKIARTTPDTPQNASTANLSRDLSHPEWLVQRWIQRFGAEITRRICLHGQSTPATTLRLRTPEAEALIVDAGISLAPGALLSFARRATSGDVTKTDPFRNGQIIIQDEASQLVASLIGHDLQGNILDCCAAPGGKTLVIADRNPQAMVTAIDLHPHRAHLLRKLARVANQERMQIVAADARHMPTSSAFTRVLADVPCSGTGTLARNPEIKWRLQPRDLSDLHTRQWAILRSAMNQVAPGARLLYSTCSLEREENEDVVEQALAGNPSFELLDCAAELQKLTAAGEFIWTGAPMTEGRYLRTIPGLHPCDGFFAAILLRK